MEWAFVEVSKNIFVTNRKVMENLFYVFHCGGRVSSDSSDLEENKKSSWESDKEDVVYSCVEGISKRISNESF